MKTKPRYTISARVLLSFLMLTAVLQAWSQPTARFSGYPLSGCAPILVQFTDQSAGNPQYWRWDLGNGTISTLQHPSATYLEPGIYNIKLTVKNAAGQDSLAQTSYIRVFAAPEIQFSASATAACGPLQVQFTDQSSSGNQWQWDFGDGIFSTQQHPTHLYRENGSYNVSLKVRNSNGCVATRVETGMIGVRAVKAGFTASVPQRCSPNRFRFTSTSTGAGNLRYHWDFGNGDSSVARDPEYQYPAAGEYSVRLRVSNEAGCTDSFSTTVKAVMPLKAGFTVPAQRYCHAPATVQFSAVQEPGLSYAWDFGDTTQSSLAAPGHLYRDTGVYSITLRVTNAAGCSDTLYRKDYIRVYQTRLELQHLPDSGCVPFTRRFEAQAVGADPITGWHWSFGDGHTSTAQQPEHTYRAAGIFDVRLIATAASGCQDTVFAPGAVKAGLRPQAAFSAEALSACAQTGIRFRDESVGQVNQWQWDYGDQTSETVQHPHHIFTDTGALDVQLIVFSNGCSDTLRKNGYVYIRPAVAKFKYDFTCEDPYRFVFSNFSMGAERWEWDLGDGTVTTDHSPVHVYADTGIYTARLRVSNAVTGCDFNVTKKLRVHDLRPDFHVSDSVACRNQELEFVSTIPTGGATRFIWDFGDGNTASAAANRITHAYDRPGRYTVRLITINLVNCRDTVLKQQYVQVYSVRAAFEVAAGQTCANSRVMFVDRSLPEGSNPIRTWTWNYGDGQAETLSAGPFSHIYTRKGHFTVALKVSDDYGCTDSVASDLQLTVQQPDARFFSADTVRCSGDEVKLVCPYAEPGVRYEWNLGDGNTSTQQIPRHRYAAPGTYTVQLKVLHPAGCTDSFRINRFIQIEDPVAAFTLSDTFRSCPPLVVDFGNQSAYASRYSWDFGDGSATSLSTPSHIYAMPGNYPITLTVTGRGGCSRSLRRRVVVKGPGGSLTYNPLTSCKSPAAVTLRAHTHDAVGYIWDFNDGVTVQHRDSVVQHLYREPGTYLPKLILSDSNGCRVPLSGTDTLRVHAVSAAFSVPDQPVCGNAAVQFSIESVSTDSIIRQEWNFGDGFFSNQLQEPLHQYLQPGVYHPELVIHTAGGCSDTARSPHPVRIARSAAVALQAPANGCTPLQAAFRAELLPGSEPVQAWSWDFGNGRHSALQEPGPQAYEAAGDYTVQLTAVTAGGCSTTVEKLISAYPSPVVKLLGDTAVCRGAVLNLSATGADTYQWGAGVDCANCATNPVRPAGTTRYTVTGRNQQGCAAADTLDVRVHEAARLTVSAPAALCAGGKVKLQVSGGQAYQWSPSTGLDNRLLASPQASPATTTTYSVVSRDNLGCASDTAYVTVTVHPLPAVEAGPERVITAGTAVLLQPEVSADVTELHWSPSGTVFRSEPGFGISVKPAASTVYTAEAINRWGCKASDAVAVKVEAAQGGLFLPNTFSPNGDGANEVFYPRAGGALRILRMKIFNREGMPVFERNQFNANDMNAGWDGRFRGAAMPQDVYLYVVEIPGADGKSQVITGNISLIR